VEHVGCSIPRHHRSRDEVSKSSKVLCAAVKKAVKKEVEGVFLREVRLEVVVEWGWYGGRGSNLSVTPYILVNVILRCFGGKMRRAQRTHDTLSGYHHRTQTYPRSIN
jgi:hypothetical protein